MKFLNKFMILIVITILFNQNSISAQNLVLNPSFETVNTASLQCSWYTSEAQFTSAISNWDYPNDGSTDIFHTSLPTSCYCHPLSTNAASNGQQSPRTGSSMSNLVTYGSGGCTPYREYLQGQLSTALTVGTTYNITMYVSLLDNCDRATNNIGIKFTTARQNTGSMCVWNTAPSANYTGAPITNKTGWTLISLTYTATAAGLQYFSIGNFLTDGATTTTAVSGSTSTIRYFIDDISVVPACSIIAEAGPNATTTCTSPSATLSGSQTGGIGTITYSWSPTTGLSSSTIANPTANPSSTTTYTLTTTDGTGCSATDVVTVTVNKTPPTANAGNDVTTTCTTPSAVLSGSGGGSYSWSPATGLSSTTSATPTANPPSTTTYTLTVTGANGCTDTDLITVTVDKTTPTANAGNDVTTTCTSPSAVLSGSGGGSYSWSPATGLSSTTSATPTANPSSTTSYTLTVTSANGCTDTDLITVTVDKTAPTANAGNDVTTTCTTPSTVLSGSGGGSYSWSPATGLSSTTSATPTANPSTTTSYTLTVTSANGCTNTDLITVTVDKTAPTANAGNDISTTCTTPSAVLSGSGGGSYSWSPATGLSSTTSATPTANPSSTTSYTLTVTGANGCTDTDLITVTVDKTAPTANAGNDVTTTCTSTSATLNGSGGVSYAWSPTTGLSNSTIANPIANPSTTTNYTLTVTAANGCTDTDDVLVTTDENSPTANAGSDVTTTCTTTSASLSGTGGGTYSWSPATGLSSSTVSNPTANPGSTTTYTLTVTAANGCTGTDNVTVTVDKAPPSISAGVDINLDCITTSGNFTATGSGTISWSTPSGTVAGNTVSVTDASASGTYTANIIGANGCVNSDDAILSIDQTIPIADAGADQTSNCATPAVSLDGSNSSGAGISFSWTGPNVTGGASSSIATADTPGQYTLTVTGSNGCTDSDDVTVNPDNNYPVADAGPDQTLDCNNSSVILDGTGSDSGANITYQWSTTSGNFVGATNNSTSEVDLNATYTLTVTNTTNGCSSVDNAAVVFDTISPVPIENNGTYTITCDITSITLDATTSSGSGNTYQWSTVDGNILTGANTATPTINLNGTYSLEILSANGCSSSSSSVVIMIDTISPSINIVNPDTITCLITTINLDASNSDPGVTYSWSTIDGSILSNQSDSIISIGSAGLYSLEITAANGCTTTANQLVEESPLPEANIIATPLSGTIPLDVNFTENCIGTGLSYLWDLGFNDSITTQNTSFTYTSEGSYEVILIITDQYGCTDADTITIEAIEIAELIIPNIFTPNQDGTNDIFKIKGTGVNTLNATVLNRWGQIVYTWDTTEGGWDGRSISGSASSEGTYFYIIEAEFLDGTSKKYTGPFSLLR